MTIVADRSKDGIPSAANSLGIHGVLKAVNCSVQFLPKWGVVGAKTKTPRNIQQDVRPMAKEMQGH